MNPTDIARVLGRIDAVWPPKKLPTDAERSEWVRFMQNLDGKVGSRAVDELKMTLGWRPSMADFRSAYNLAATLPDDDVKALPGARGEQQTEWEDIYGAHQGQWVYCWRCDMAITLDERCDEPLHHAAKGLRHRQCPRSGSAPVMPVHLRLKREEYFSKHRVSS